MLNTNYSKSIKFAFFPALILSVFFSCSSTLFQFSQNALINNQFGFDQISTLKVLRIVPEILLAVVLFIFSIRKPFEKVFKSTLIVLTGVAVLAAGLMFFQEYLVLNGVSEIFGVYKPLIAHWPISLTYLILSVFHFSLYVLVWGFINRLMSLSAGVKYYIRFAFVLGIAGGFVSNLGLTAMGAYKWSLMGLMIPAIASLVCTFFLFDWFWKRLPDSLLSPQEPPVSQTRFPFLSAAYLLAGSAMIKSVLDVIFKSELNIQLPGTASYTKLLGAYSVTVGTATIAISIIWVVLGTWLLLKKGWKTTALYASLSILVGGVVFLSLSSSWLVQGIFNGLLMGTASALFFPLIQILYLYLPYQNRFKTKIVTEMIALPVMKAVPSLITQGLLVAFGSVAAIVLYLKILVPVFVVLLVIASYIGGLKTVNRD